MKRKYLSALLMGTLTVASMSTFTSCKDYDDDISNLQGQIDKLASADELAAKVSELQALISANKSDITSLQSELAKKTTLDEVKAVLANYAEKQYVEDALATLDAAVKAQGGDITALQDAVKAAQAAADKAAEDAKAANAEILETLETLATKAEVEDVKTAAKAANDAIEALKTGDIKTLQDKQNEILESLKTYAKQEKLDEVAAKAEALQTALDEKADTEALTKAEKDLNDAIAAVKTTAGENATAIEGLATTVQNAKDALALAQANQTKLEEALASLNDSSKEGTVAAAIKTIQAQVGTPNKELGTLDTRLAAIESVLNGVKDDDTKLGLATKVTNIENKLKDIIGQYSTMVTDVQLFEFAVPNRSGFDRTLNFAQVVELDNVFPAEGVADGKFTFTKGNYHIGEDSLLVRVSPVDAELTKSNVSLLNSQGKELDDLIEVTDVHRYNKLLLGGTRAADNDIKSGLWVVKFKAKEVGENFKAAVEAKDEYDNTCAVLYSVAVKNTYNTTGEKKDEETRRVTSEYAVDLNTYKAQHAWDFSVNGKEISYIHNRYIFTEESRNRTDDKKNHPDTYAQELTWLDNNKPATSVILDGDNKNAVDRKDHTLGVYNGVDQRQAYSILAVEKGKNITIDFTNNNDSKKNVKGFYVTLDEKFAGESKPSELNAWNSYSYENVGYKKNGTEVVPAHLFTGNKGTIKIKDLGNVKGDVIGFRVYAVNYDGTLTDPDGRAFYVAVGDVKTDVTIPATNLTYNLEQKKFMSEPVDIENIISALDFDAQDYAWTVAEKDADNKMPTGVDAIYVLADGKKTRELSNAVKKVIFEISNPGTFIDGETYKVQATLTKQISSATATVSTVTASFKKVMPTEAPEFAYRDGFGKDINKYIIPDNGNYKISGYNKGGYYDFRNILVINNNKTSWNGFDLFDTNSESMGVFNFNVANGTWNNDQLEEAKAYPSSYRLYVNNSNDRDRNLVDNKTERTITGKFYYNRISKHLNQDGTGYVENDSYAVKSKSSEKLTYCSWIKTFDVLVGERTTWVTGTNNTVTWTADQSVVTTLDLANLGTKIKDADLLPVALTGVDAKKFSTYMTAGVLAPVYNNEDNVYVWTTSKGGSQYNPYFRAEFSNDRTQIILTQNNQGSIPTSVTGGEIHFIVKDCFGNEKEIILPFVIKK